MLKAITIKENELFLRKISKIVDFNDKDLPQNLKDIEEYCLNNNGLFAMACIQLGIPKRIIYIKSTDPNNINSNNKGFIMINPKIKEMKGKTEFWEGCVSCLDNLALVERPYKITVEYQNIHNDTITKEFEGFPSTVISHEIDHLDGIFHMDRSKEIIQLNKEERIEFRKLHPYKIISKDCEFNY